MKRILFIFLLAPHTIFCPPCGARTFTVTNTNDSGPGSFRAAVAQFNHGYDEGDTIEFILPGNGPFYIHLLSDLKISRENGVIFSTLPVTIRGNGSFKRKHSSTLIGNLNWIRQQKSLREIATAVIAQQIVATKCEKKNALERLPAELRESVSYECTKEICKQTAEDWKNIGPWDLQIHSGVSMPLIWGPAPSYYKD